jgi:ATP/maltotriose-dependent transcriptional regulator MalT
LAATRPQIELYARSLQEVRRYRRKLQTFAPTPGISPGAAGVALTARQREVLELVAAGFSNQETSNRLAIDVSTVDTHVRHVVGGRLNVRDRADAAH